MHRLMLLVSVVSLIFVAYQKHQERRQMMALWSEIPTINQIRQELGSDAHADISDQLVKAAMAIGEVYDRGAKDWTLQKSSLEFLKTCSSESQFLEIIRDSCKKRLNELSRVHL